MAHVVNRQHSPMASASSNDDEQMDNNDATPGGNEGWANVFAKVLTQNPKRKNSKKSVILSKARKDAEIQHRKELQEAEKARNKKEEEEEEKNRNRNRNKNKMNLKKKKNNNKASEPMKIVDSKGNVVDEDSVSEAEEDSSSDPDCGKKDDPVEKLRRKKNRLNYGHVLPQPGDPYEKNLLKTATKGVVQLFNAVNKHQEQKRMKQKADSSDEEDCRYKKGQFMDTLYKIHEKKKSKDESKWEALKDDFMMNSKMRDWDKQDESDAE